MAFCSWHDLALPTGFVNILNLRFRSLEPSALALLPFQPHQLRRPREFSQLSLWLWWGCGTGCCSWHSRQHPATKFGKR